MAKFTSATAIRMMPRKSSAVWDSMITNLRSMSYRGKGTRGHHAVVSIDPSTINSKNIQWLLAFNRIATARQTREALEEVGSFIAHQVNERYFSQEGLTVGSWEELKETTLKWREAKGFADSPILQASGDMYNLATSDAAINEINTGMNPSVVMGGAHWPTPEAEKFFVHMGGSWSQLYKAPIPARPFMPQDENDFTPYEEKRIKEIFQEHIYKLMDYA